MPYMKEETYRALVKNNSHILSRYDEIESRAGELLKNPVSKTKNCDHITCSDCENLFTMCKATGEVKNFIPNANCPKLNCSSCGDEQVIRQYYPSIRELLDIWYPHYARINNTRTSDNGHRGKPSLSTMTSTIAAVKRSAKVAHIDIDEPIINVTRRRLKIGIIDWYDGLKMRKLNGESVVVPSEYTIYSYLQCWGNITPKWLREMCDEDGVISVPKIDIPKITIHRIPWKKPTEEQYIKYNQYISRLENSHSMEWAMTIFQRETGCRNGDVINAMWDNFSIRNGKCIYTYKDNKTGKTAPQLMDISVLDKLLSWKKYYFSKNGPNKYFKIGHENDPHVFGSIHITREDGSKYYIPAKHPEEWKRITKGMRDCGICDLRTDNKGAYQNRALKGQEVREKHGEEVMNAVLHNSHKVSTRYSELDVIREMSKE